MSNFDPALKTGTTWADFQRVGNLPELSETVNKLDKGKARDDPHALKNDCGRPSGPIEFLPSSLFNIFNTESLQIQTLFKSTVMDIGGLKFFKCKLLV